jgi:hypothetical protein
VTVFVNPSVRAENANFEVVCQVRSLRALTSEIAPETAAANTSTVTGQNPIARSSDIMTVPKGATRVQSPVT